MVRNGAIHVELTDDLPYGPGQSDYEYDGYIARQMSDAQLVDELTYINYKHNRNHSPDRTPEQWARVYPNAEALEKRYQDERAKESA